MIRLCRNARLPGKKDYAHTVGQSLNMTQCGLGPTQTHFNPRLAAQAKVSLSRAQNIFKLYCSISL